MKKFDDLVNPELKNQVHLNLVSTAVDTESAKKLFSTVKDLVHRRKIDSF